MACRAALKEEVLAMEKGTETVIGSGGTRLSGGQAQRLALARTLAHPRPVLVLESAHPSPLSAYRGFFGSAPFGKVNAFLKNTVQRKSTGVCPQTQPTVDRLTG